jgi:site-specific recombinase XerD
MVRNKSVEKLSVLPLLELAAAASQHLENLGYSPHTRENYYRVWKQMARFGNTNTFTQKLVYEFLASLGVHIKSPGQWYATKAYQREACVAVRILMEFSQQSRWERRRITKIIDLPTKLQLYLDGYKDHILNTRGGSLRTFTSRAWYLKKFLEFVIGRVGTDLSNLKVAHIADFLAREQDLAPETLATRICTLRSFCRYLFMSGVFTQDLAVHLPIPRFTRDHHIPTVWTHTQVEAILAAVDRSSPRGKRDYAILLLACRLGMRAEDIRQLRLEDLHWSEGQIVMSQSKTHNPLNLPLLEDIGQALIDYFRHGRPASLCREIFLRANAPFEPFTNNVALWHIFNNHRRVAGVAVPADASHGIHSLRHTMATHLLQAGTPLKTISQIMGHTSSESTRIYLKVDVEALRSAALNLKEVDHA